MGGRHKIWLIPALIIGFNCLAFVALLAISLNRGRRPSPEEAFTVSRDAGVQNAEIDVVEEGTSEGRGGTHELAESFYDEEVPEEKSFGSGYVLLLTSTEADLRIQMVDSNGAAPEGMSWTARITDDRG